jgi:hypothetical protein
VAQSYATGLVAKMCGMVWETRARRMQFAINKYIEFKTNSTTKFNSIFQQGNFSASQNELSSPFSTLFQDIASELAFNNGTTSGQQTIKINDFVSGVESGAPQDFSPCSWTDDIRQRRKVGHSFTESPVRREKSCAIASNRLICILNHRPRNNRRGCMTARRANIVAFFSFTSYF